MCGRFTLNSNRVNIRNYLDVVSWDPGFIWKLSYNIAPSQEIPVLTYNNKFKE